MDGQFSTLGRVQLLAAGLAVLVTTVAAQTPDVGLDPSKALSQYIIKAWGVDAGLPQNTVNALAQTEDGYLWLATGEGLARFDGRRFTVYDPQSSPSFVVSEINALAVDPSGNLWVGTRGGGVLRYDGDVFTPFLEGEYVTTLATPADGSVWVGTYGSGAARIRGDTVDRFGPDEGLEAEFISTIFSRSNGDLLLATEIGVHAFRDGRIHQMDDVVLGSSFVSALFEDASGALWVGVRDGHVLRRAGDSETVIIDAASAAGHASAFVQDAVGTVWIASSGGGLARYDDGRIDRLTEDNGLSNNDALALFEDREANLWVGTGGGGLVRIREGKFTMYSDREGLGHNNVYSAFASTDGSMWFGHDGGASQLADGRLVDRSDDLGLSGADVLTIGEDGSGQLHFGTYGTGVVSLNGMQTSTLTTGDGLASDAIFVIHRDRRDRLWIGTDSGVSVAQGRTLTTYTSAEGLASDFITAIADGPDGTIYIGTYDGGLSIFEEGEFRTISTDDGLASNAVLSLYVDDEGVVWVGTWGSGLSRIENGRIASYSSKDGLFNDNVFVILEDGSEQLWFTSNKGISRVRKTDFDALDAGRIERLTAEVFDGEDGLWSVESNGGQQPAGWESADGKLWFPTVAGVASIDPANIRQNPVLPPVVIERVVVDNRAINIAGSLELSPGSDKLEIDYTALSLTAPEDVRFRYRLDGADEDWYDAQDRRQAFYTNLDPGHYTFRVIASNNDGLWNEKGAALTFYLKPFFYQTTWFKTLCIAVIVILLFFAYRWRVAQMRAREKYLEKVVDERTHDLRLEKEKVEESNRVISEQAERLQELDRFKTRFFANISHEFRTPLTMIIGPLENALQGAYGALNDNMRDHVQMMLRNGLRLMRLINQLLDLSKLESGKMQLRARSRNVVQFLDGVLHTFTAFAEQKNVTLTFDSDFEDIELLFEPDKFEKIFFNLLSNAAKFTPEGGEIGMAVRTIASDDEAASVEIRVRDTGRGIPKKDLPHIFDRFHQVDGSNTREHEGTGIGLALVNELVLLHKGTISVDSEIGKGTEFTLTFPTGTAHLDIDQIVEETPREDIGERHHGAMVELAAATLNFANAGESQIERPSEPTPDLTNAPLVLVAEDNSDVREYIGGILRTHYRVELAEDGQAALERARETVPHLILSDVMMPRMDGNEFCRRVKGDPDLNHIPVVLLTARATHESKMEGLSAGADDYLAKPFNANELLARVSNLLKIRDQERELKSFNAELAAKVDEQVQFILKQREVYEGELILARDRAEESARLKSAILNNVSHELRTPITAIVGYAQLLRPELKGEQLDFIDTIVAGGDRLSEVLDAVLTLSELDARTSNATDHEQYPKVDIRSVVEDAAYRSAAAAEKRGLNLETAVPDAPVYAHADEAGLNRVLRILLDNAVKFTESGGHIGVRIENDEDWARVVVIDSGVGIDAQYLPRLFDAFTQESEGLARSHDGIGLGLAIADRLVKLQGGKIDVSTKKGVGSKFTVVLPRNVRSAPSRAETSDRPPVDRNADMPRAAQSRGAANDKQ